MPPRGLWGSLASLGALFDNQAMSINQNANPGALPDFRNLGILLRILVIVGGMSLAAALLKAEESRALMEELIDLSALVQPILLPRLLVLAAAHSWLHRLRYPYAIAAP